MRPQLNSADSHEQAFAQKAAALRAMTKAVERLLANEKRKPTKDGALTVADALNSLDRATAAVEYDFDRIALRMAQESLLPPGQPFCICIAPPFAEVSPLGPTPCSPAIRVTTILAAGEAESFQLVVVPYWEPLVDVRVEVSDLFRPNTIDRFKPDQLRLWLVGSVASTSTLGRAQFWPDPLTALRPFDLPATVSQAILVDIRARKDQPAGLYEGLLTIRPQSLRPISIPLQVLVRTFALPDGLPEVTFRIRNDAIQKQFIVSATSRFTQEWQTFLSAFGFGLYRPTGPDDSAEGWLPWLDEEVSPFVGTPAIIPKVPLLVASLPYRQTAWAAWNDQHRYDLPSFRWVVNGWVSLDSSSSEPFQLRNSPFVRNYWFGKPLENPPGLICVNRRGEPEPTVRLVALRDGIEDFRYFALLAHKLVETKERKAAGWWKRHRWSRLLSIDPKLGDPKRASPGTFSRMVEVREKVARAIEQAQQCLDRTEGKKKK